MKNTCEYKNKLVLKSQIILYQVVRENKGVYGGE